MLLIHGKGRSKALSPAYITYLQPLTLNEKGKRFFCTFIQEEKDMITIPSIDMMATGQNIIKLRKDAGLTVKDLQMMFGFTTPQAIYKWQHGTAMPTVDNLLVLAVVFGVHIDDIIVSDTVSKSQIGA